MIKYKLRKQKNDTDEDLLDSIIRGLEDIKAGRIRRVKWMKLYFKNKY